MAFNAICFVTLMSVFFTLIDGRRGYSCPFYNCASNFPADCNQTCPAGLKLGWDTKCPRCCKPCVIPEGGSCSLQEADVLNSEKPPSCEWPSICINGICTGSSQTTVA